MDSLTDPSVDTIVLLFSSQIGKTEALINGMLFGFSVDPGPGMMVMPTLETGRLVLSRSPDSGFEVVRVDRDHCDPDHGRRHPPQAVERIPADTLRGELSGVPRIAARSVAVVRRDRPHAGIHA